MSDVAVTMNINSDSQQSPSVPTTTLRVSRIIDGQEVVEDFVAPNEAVPRLCQALASHTDIRSITTI